MFFLPTKYYFHLNYYAFDVCSEGHIVRIERLEVGDAGTYRCEARNQEGGNSSSIQISVDSSEYQFIFLRMRAYF